MKMRIALRFARYGLSGLVFAMGMGTASAAPEPPATKACLLVSEGHGPAGSPEVTTEVVTSGLKVPWGVAFLPGPVGPSPSASSGAGGKADTLLVTERPGRIRLVSKGKLVAKPVAEIEVAAREEGGLSGIVLHPDFAKNRFFYVYYSYGPARAVRNRVERYRLAVDNLSAKPDRVIIENIPGGTNHDGGRIHFGPDGMLYVGTGDAREAELSQKLDSTAGKILRLTPDGSIPADNPKGRKNPVFLSGIRNTQGFDWIDEKTLVVTDHGPSGERGREGHDEVSFARAGENLGWPTIYGCETKAGFVTPALTWEDAAPPGGAALYRGAVMPEWQGDLFVATLRSRHLHRVSFDPKNPQRVKAHEVYFKGDPPQGLGRLREVVMGPDGYLYITTSNCDGRGRCPPEGDSILRLVKMK